MKNKHIFHLTALTLFITLIALTSGCKSKAKASETSAKAAIVPSADLVAVMDISSMQQSAIYKKGQKKQKEMLKNNPMAEEQEKKKKRFEKASGLTDEDLISFTMSMDFAGIDFEEKDAGRNIEKLNIAGAVDLRKPITKENLKKVINLAMEEAASQGKSVNTTITEENIAERYVIRLSNIPVGNSSPMAQKKSGNEESIEMFTALSKNGKVVFFTLNKKSMTEMLARVDNEKVEDTPPALQSLEKNLPENSQFELLFLAPQELRDSIKANIAKTEKAAAKNPGAGMALGFAKPFEKLQSLGMGMKLSNRMDLSLITDLGDPQQAQQVSGLINGMVVPMLKGQIQQQMQKAGKDPVNMDQLIKVSAADSSVKLDIIMTEEMLDNAATLQPGMPGTAPSPSPRVSPMNSPKSAPQSSVRQPSEASGSVASLTGKPLSAVQAQMGHPKGKLEAGGKTVWMYDNYEVHSENGETVSAIKDTSGGELTPVTSGKPVK